MKLIAKIAIAAVSTCLLSAPVAFSQSIQVPGPAGQIFLDDFEAYAVQTGSVPYDYYQNGSLASVGVSTDGVTGQAGFFSVAFNGTSFGGGIYDTLEGNSLNLTGAFLSIAVKSSAGPAINAYFSLRIVDSAQNGSRSPLFNPTANFTTFAPNVSTFIGNGGNGKPNLAAITEIDIIAYDTGDSTTTTLTFDNFQATTAPEPSTVASIMLLGGALFVVYKRKQQSVSA